MPLEILSHLMVTHPGSRPLGNPHCNVVLRRGRRLVPSIQSCGLKVPDWLGPGNSVALPWLNPCCSGRGTKCLDICEAFGRTDTPGIGSVSEKNGC